MIEPYHRVGSKRTMFHRVVWEEANGPIPDGMEVDHINGDTKDNRLENLRIVTHSDNLKNSKIRTDNKSGVVGVRWDKWRSKWAVQITSQGKMKPLGRYTDFFEAVCVRMSANNIYGYHPNHGRR